MPDVLDCLKEFVHEFMERASTDAVGPPNFDQFPSLQRLLCNTFEVRRTRGASSLVLLWLVFSIIAPVIAIILLPIFDPPEGGAKHCMLRKPDWLAQLLRSPVNCSFCVNVTEVDRVEHVLYNNEFMATYVNMGKPVVVEDATKNWSASATFSFEFFRSLYLNKTGASCQFFPYASKFESLQHVLETATLEEGEQPWYVGWSNCDSETAEILRSHYDRPYFLPDDSESSHADWIFMGSPGYGANLHVDEVGHPSWQAQIRGWKKWFLYPPPECHYSCSRKFLEVTLRPGDTLVVNTNWWYHQTEAFGDELSISIGSEFD